MTACVARTHAYTYIVYKIRAVHGRILHDISANSIVDFFKKKKEKYTSSFDLYNGWSWNLFRVFRQKVHCIVTRYCVDLI